MDVVVPFIQLCMGLWCPFETAATLFMKIKKYLQVLMALVLDNHKQSKCVNLRLDGGMMTYSRLFSCFFPSNSFFESKILNKTANTTIAISKQISHKRNQWKYNYSVNRLQQIKFSSSHILSLSHFHWAARVFNLMWFFLRIEIGSWSAIDISHFIEMEDAIYRTYIYVLHLLSIYLTFCGHPSKNYIPMP